jgi:hypothetical protein
MIAITKLKRISKPQRIFFIKPSSSKLQRN